MPVIVAAHPFLGVRDIPVSVAWYRDKLGFTPRHEEEEFAVVQRDGIDLMLVRLADEGWRSRPDLASRPVVSGAESFLAGTGTCRIRVDGLDALHAELAPNGVLHGCGGITEQWWGDREFHARDADGNLLTFYEPVARSGP